MAEGLMAVMGISKSERMIDATSSWSGAEVVEVAAEREERSDWRASKMGLREET